MKKLRYVIAILAMATLGMFAISSCSITSNSILGSWVWESQEAKLTLHFSSDNSCSWRYEFYQWPDQNWTDEYTYEYNASKNELILHSIEPDEYGADVYEVVINGNELTLTDDEGVAMVFHKVK